MLYPTKGSAPGGQQILVVSVSFPYDPHSPWREAIAAGATHLPNETVAEAESLFPPEGNAVSAQGQYFLVNTPAGDGYGIACAFAENARLSKTSPRQAFAVGAKYPSLQRELDRNHIHLTCTDTAQSRKGQRILTCVAGLRFDTYYGPSNDSRESFFHEIECTEARYCPIDAPSYWFLFQKK